MTKPIVLWIDLRLGNPSRHLEYSLTSLCEVYRETNTEWILSTIPKLAPQLLLFHYDYPDLVGLKTLQETKILFPALPIIMLTEHHSERLAVWAFRVGVRDYLHSPPPTEELVERVRMFSQIPVQPDGPKPRVNPLAMQPIPTEACCVPAAKQRVNIKRSLSYIDTHLSERITLNDIADSCGLTTFAFSRGFKKTFGITFQEYLIRLRIDRAQQLLANPRLSVTEVAGEAGFGDLSHFTRTFRRYVGTSPSSYRRREQLTEQGQTSPGSSP